MCGMTRRVLCAVCLAAVGAVVAVADTGEESSVHTNKSAVGRPTKISNPVVVDGRVSSSSSIEEETSSFATAVARPTFPFEESEASRTFSSVVVDDGPSLPLQVDGRDVRTFRSFRGLQDGQVEQPAENETMSEPEVAQQGGDGDQDEHQDDHQDDVDAEHEGNHDEADDHDGDQDEGHHDEDDGEGDEDHHDESHEDEEHEEFTDATSASFEASTEDGRNIEKPWGAVILATFAINALTLVGIVILAPGVGRARLLCLALFQGNRAEKNGQAAQVEAPAASAVGADCSKGTNKNGGGSKLVDIGLPSFAAGALLSTAVFLILPESLLWMKRGVVSVISVDSHDHHRRLLFVRSLQEGGDDHHDDDHNDDHGAGADAHDDHSSEGGGESGAAWRFGASVLGGFLLPLVLGALFPRSAEHVCDDECGESPTLRNNAAAVALVPPVLEESPDSFEIDDHCCRCEVEALERRGVKVVGVGGDCNMDTTKPETTSVVSDCPSCRGDAPCCGGSNRDVEKGIDEEGKKLCKDRHDNDQPHDGDHNHDHTGHSPEKGGVKEMDRSLHSVLSMISLRRACRHQSPRMRRQRNKVRNAINYSLCASILLGDGFHNYADGIFIGISFMLCGNEIAMSVLAVTLYHEVAQELADFFLLTRHAGLGVGMALALNFLSGMSVMLGGITILAVDLSAQAIGAILGVAAGVYIHIAASECMPRVEEAAKGWKDRALSFGMFLVGAVPIGLALINHEHCEG